eukprot:403346874
MNDNESQGDISRMSIDHELQTNNQYQNQYIELERQVSGTSTNSDFQQNTYNKMEGAEQLLKRQMFDSQQSNPVNLMMNSTKEGTMVGQSYPKRSNGLLFQSKSNIEDEIQKHQKKQNSDSKLMNQISMNAQKEKDRKKTDMGSGNKKCKKNSKSQNNDLDKSQNSSAEKSQISKKSKSKKSNEKISQKQEDRLTAMFSALPQEEVILQKKIVVLGQSGVGKTTLIKRYVLGDSNILTKSGTLGAEQTKKDIEIQDFACQERFRSLSPLYYRDADAAIFVYDVYNEKTFKEIQEYWIPSIMEFGPANMVFAIVGTRLNSFEKQNQLAQNEITPVEQADIIELQISRDIVISKTICLDSEDSIEQIDKLFMDIGEKIKQTGNNCTRQRYQSVRLSRARLSNNKKRLNPQKCC